MVKVHHPAKNGEDPVRITTASTSRAEDIATRQKRYVIAMSTRVACFVGAVLAGVAGITWLWPILIAGAIVLPYVAVVMANATDNRGDDFSLDDSPFDRPQLPPGKNDKD